MWKPDRAVLGAALILVIVLMLVLAVNMLTRETRALLPGPYVVGCRTPGGTQSELRAMAYNIWGGGLAGGYALQRTADVIAQVQPQIVAIQERFYQEVDRLPDLAQLTGMTLVNEASVLTSLPVLSSQRLFEPTSHTCGIAELRMPDGESVYVYNVHLQSYPYGPHAVRDGEARTAEEAAEVEAPRVKQMDEILKDMQRRLPANARVILLGDFNAPSHRDWAVPTERTYNLAVRWPVTVAAERAGFADAYRAVHPDPINRVTPRGATVVGRPGFTYSPVVREDNDHMPFDRIDMIFARGPGLRICDAFIVGEPGASDLSVAPWPSDHRAVVGDLGWDK